MILLTSRKRCRQAKSYTSIFSERWSITQNGDQNRIYPSFRLQYFTLFKGFKKSLAVKNAQTVKPLPKAVCDRIGNSGQNRNRNQIAMIWPKPEPECHPKKVDGFDRIGRILPDFLKSNFSLTYKCYKSLNLAKFCAQDL